MTDSLSGSILSQRSVRTFVRLVSVAVTRQKEVTPIDWNVYSQNHSHPSRLQHSRRNREAMRLPLVNSHTTNGGTYVSVRSLESNKQFSASVSPRGRRKWTRSIPTISQLGPICQSGLDLRTLVCLLGCAAFPLHRANNSKSQDGRKTCRRWYAANRTTLENKLWLTFLILNSSGTWRQIKSLVSDRDLFTAARSAGNVKNWSSFLEL